LAMGGAALVTLAIDFNSRAGTEKNWDSMAAKYDSLTHFQIVPAASKAIGEAAPTSSAFYGALGITVAGSSLLAYAYACAFVTREVKRLDKTLISADFFAVLVPYHFMVVAAPGCEARRTAVRPGDIRVNETCCVDRQPRSLGR